MRAYDDGLSYLFQDHQGTTRAITKSDGSMAVARDHSPYGRTLRESGADGTRQQYAMLERDGESGLDHSWWRKYDSTSGRWTSPDPYNGSMSVGDPQSFNRYSYVRNDPVNFTDPLGLQGQPQQQQSSCDSNPAPPPPPAPHTSRQPPPLRNAFTSRGKGYGDLNFSLGSPVFLGITGGIIIDSDGVYPYFGGGAMNPGPSVALYSSPNSVTPGWNAAFSGGAVIGGSIGRDRNGDPFYEVGGTTPGISATGYYVFTVPWLSTCFTRPNNQAPPPTNDQSPLRYSSGGGGGFAIPPYNGRGFFYNFNSFRLLDMMYGHSRTINGGNLGTITIYADGSSTYVGPLIKVN